MFTVFDDPSFVEDDDSLSPLDGRKPVGNEQNGSVLGQRFQVCHKAGLGLSIEGGSGFIQQEDTRGIRRGAAKKRTRQGDSLPLPHR